MAFKGEGFRAPLDRVMSVIMDAPAHRMDDPGALGRGCERTVKIRASNTSHGHAVAVADRDFIYHATLGTDGTGKVITFKAHSLRTLIPCPWSVRAESLFDFC